MAIFDKLKGFFGKSSGEVSDAHGDADNDSDENVLRGTPGKQKRKLDVAKRFVLDRQSSSGTMSKFHLAKEISSGQMVGIKFIDIEKKEHFEARFKGLNKPSEGEIGMQLKHERIVQTYEYGVTTNNEPYILMEYVPGLGLSTLINEKSPLLNGKRLKLIRQMADAIEALHAAGFIHRDVCPRNFICAEDASWLKLIDFGLTVPDQREYRMPGNRTGTPLYMAPEIVRRRDTDKRVDIFAFGVTCFRLLTGEHPWSSGGDTSGTAALAHDSTPPKNIFDLRPQTERTLGEAVMKCIKSKPEQRFESMELLLKDLKRVRHEDA